MHRSTTFHRLALACLLSGLGACDSPSEPRDPPVVTVSTQSVQLAIGQTTTVTASVTGAANTAVIWRTNAPDVATVSALGVITGVGFGQATITALSVADTSATASLIVTVEPPFTTVADTLRVLGLGAVNERYTSEVAVHGDWAYTGTWGNRGVAGNAVKIWNVAGSVPVLVDSLRITPASTIGDVQISDDGSLLVVAVEPNPNGAIVIYDRSNPALPVQLTRFASANTAPGVHTLKLGRVGARHYAFLSIDPGAQPARLVTVDITDPRNPVEVRSETMGRPYVHDVFVRDGLLFTALWDDGMRIYDIGGGSRGGTPTAPVILGQVQTATGNIHNIWWFHDPVTGSKRYAFLGEEGPGSVLNTASGDIHVIDVTNMSAPVQVAIYRVPGAGAHNFSMDEQNGILYAAYYNGGVRALNVRGDLGTCLPHQKTAAGLCDLKLMGRERAVALTSDSYVWGVAYQGAHVYASDMVDGLYKLEAVTGSPLSRGMVH